jgi:hypothetical protein
MQRILDWLGVTEVLDRFWDKVRNSYKSGTMYLGAFIIMMGGTLKMLEWAQSSLLPQITPLVNPTFAAWATSAIGLAIWYFRFKTFQSLTDK